MQLYLWLLLWLIQIKLSQAQNPICTSEILNEIAKCLEKEKYYVEYLLQHHLNKGDVPGGATYWRKYYPNYRQCLDKKSNFVNMQGCCASPQTDESKSVCIEIDRLWKIWSDNWNLLNFSLKGNEEVKEFWDIVFGKDPNKPN